MSFNVIKYLDGDKKGEVAIVTNGDYNQIARDENGPNIKWYGEIKIENICEELLSLIYEYEQEDSEANK